MTVAGAVIDGVSISGGYRMEVTNPSTEQLVSVVDGGGEKEALAAVAAAESAFPAWAVLPDTDRQALLCRCADIIEEHAEELARLLTSEQGKPLGGMGSRFEIGGAAAWTRATAALRLPIDTIQDDESANVTVHRKPLGVVASITPWNWPVMIAIWHIMPALRVGNTVVIKPSPYTPLTTLRIVEMLQQVLPAGVLNAVAGGDAIGPVLTAHPDVAKITFTGSTPTGQRVMESAAPTLKRLTLELGGNDAGIVLPDSDPAAIAEGLFWGAFINSGQTCAALKRLYVHNDIYDAVCTKLVAYAQTVAVGDGLDEASLLGPIQNRMQLEKVAKLVDAARDDGAQILIGGARNEGDGFYYPITLVSEARDGMALVDEEQFGPALPIIRYDDIDEVISRANALSFGLGGSIWSSDQARARELALRLECGTVWVNKHGTLRPDIPFGGIKASGFGVEFGQYGLEEFVSLRVVND